MLFFLTLLLLCCARAASLEAIDRMPSLLLLLS